MILSTSVLERGADSPTMLLRLAPLGGRLLLAAKAAAGVAAFVHALLPLAALAGLAFAYHLLPLGTLALAAAVLAATCLQAALMSLAFSVASREPGAAYRQTLQALLLFSCVPGLAPWHFLLLDFNWIPNFGFGTFGFFWSATFGARAVVTIALAPWFVPLMAFLSAYLPIAAWKRAAEHLDDPDDLVALKVQPEWATRPFFGLHAAQWLFGRLLFMVGVGAAVPALSVSAYLLESRLENAQLAAWLLLQSLATIGLATALTRRLAFSPYFDAASPMSRMLLLAPTSGWWWFRKLLARRHPELWIAAAAFVAMSLLCLPLGLDVAPALWTIVAGELAFGTLFLFAFTLVCRPRFLALMALAAYLAFAYLPGLAGAALHDPRFLAGAAVVAAVAAVAARRRWPPALVALAAALHHLRGVPWALAGGNAWSTLGGALRQEPLVGFTRHGKSYLWLLAAGELLTLLLAAWWLRRSFDFLVGRAGPRRRPRRAR